MKYSYRLPLKTTLLLILGSASAAYAGAWLQDEGKGLYIQNNSYYSTGKYFDNSGHSTSMSNYSKFEINPYAEYGLYDWLTVGTNLSLQRAQQDSAIAATQKSWGIGDSEFFARTRLWQGNGFSFLAEPLVKLPSPSSTTSDPKIGGSHGDLGMSLLSGYGFRAFAQNHFVELDTGYRYRLGQPEDQLRFTATAGLSLTPKWQLMPQVFVTRRMGTPNVVTFTESSSDDYNLTKLQMSAVYKYTDSVSLQAAYFDNVDGKNVGGGNGVILSIWKSF